MRQEPRTPEPALVCWSVFGNQRIDSNTGGMVPFTNTDCPGGTIISSPLASWDPNRPAMTARLYLQCAFEKHAARELFWPAHRRKPESRWLEHGFGSMGARNRRQRWHTDNTRTGDFNNRKQINVKIDHNFNNSHKLSVSYTLERNTADAGTSNWPNGYGGTIDRNPHVLSTNFTSTLSPNLVNEARVGMRFNDTQGRLAWEVHSDELHDVLSPITGGPDRDSHGQPAPPILHCSMRALPARLIAIPVRIHSIAMPDRTTATGASFTPTATR